jgi:hypothetical protein
MNPLQSKWESRLLEHRFCAEIVADFTTRMETNVSGLNDAKFQVKTLLQSMLCIFTFVEMEFPVSYGVRY